MKRGIVHVSVVVAVLTTAICPTFGATRASAAHDVSPKYLLALGDSLAAGYQRIFATQLPPVDPTTGYRDGGYPGSYGQDVARASGMQLIDLGCPGETTRSMSGTPAAGACTALYRSEFGANSQLGAAQSFLSRERGEVGLVTLDIGANDLDACIVNRSVNYRCLGDVVPAALSATARIISLLGAKLSEFDPGARLVALNYYDPFLALAYSPGGTRGRAEAAETLAAVNLFDAQLAVIFRTEHVSEANVASAFHIDQLVPLERFRGDDLASDVATTCELTWMCPATGEHPDIHPNDAGYAVIAQAIEKTMNP